MYYGLSRKGNFIVLWKGKDSSSILLGASIDPSVPITKRLIQKLKILLLKMI